MSVKANMKKQKWQMLNDWTTVSLLTTSKTGVFRYKIWGTAEACNYIFYQSVTFFNYLWWRDFLGIIYITFVPVSGCINCWTATQSNKLIIWICIEINLLNNCVVSLLLNSTYPLLRRSYYFKRNYHLSRPYPALRHLIGEKCYRLVEEGHDMRGFLSPGRSFSSVRLRHR